MDINEALNFLNGLIKNANKKSEIKLYENFIEVLTALKDKNLNEEDFRSIEEELEKLSLKNGVDNGKKQLTKKFSQFKSFLKDNFSLVTEGYFTILGIGIGVAFGSTLGSVFGSVFGIEPGMQIIFGPPFGLIIGLLVGAYLDNEAEKQNRVLKVKS